MMARVNESELIAAGLYDPDAPAATDRLALLQHLLESGASLDEIAAAQEQDVLTWLAVDLLLRPADGQPLVEVAAVAGIGPDLVERAQRALGLPPQPGATYDQGSVSSLSAAAAFFGEDRTLQFNRVLGSSIARVIDAAMSLFVAETTGPQVAAFSELELSQRSEDAARLLLALPTTIEALFPSYVKDAVRRQRLTGQDASGGVRAAVGFVDLVGSTGLVQRLPGPELARAVGEFESAAQDAALNNDGRVVKFIGDAAMFVCPDADSACNIGLTLCEVVAAHPVLTQARGAVGFGTMVAQDGDYYGTVVNLASRLTSVAAPGQLLCTPAVQSAVDVTRPSFRFAAAGSHPLRGFDEPVRALSVARALDRAD